MAGRVEGKVCVITGGASGIGLATCRRLAQEGGRVAVADIDAAAAERAAAELGGDAAAFTVDVSADASVAALYGEVIERYGRIDVCHNNAGILLDGDGDPVETTPGTWARILAVNLTGVFLCLHHQIPHMLRSGGGSIINTASFVALMGAATPQIAYSASKGGVLSMTREVAAVYAKRGIRCNAVCPGPIDTGLLDQLLADEHEWGRRSVHLPDGRLGRPEEVANAVLHLASDESSWTNGTAMLVDGGITATYTTPE
jgi:NAD(P)-dependent dehydrogenase (short-subunit alcohol dehydrogenase family)